MARLIAKKHGFWRLELYDVGCINESTLYLKNIKNTRIKHISIVHLTIHLFTRLLIHKQTYEQTNSSMTVSKQVGSLQPIKSLSSSKKSITAVLHSLPFFRSSYSRNTNSRFCRSEEVYIFHSSSDLMTLHWSRINEWHTGELVARKNIPLGNREKSRSEGNVVGNASQLDRSIESKHACLENVHLESMKNEKKTLQLYKF